MVLTLLWCFSVMAMSEEVSKIRVPLIPKRPSNETVSSAESNLTNIQSSSMTKNDEEITSNTLDESSTSQETEQSPIIKIPFLKTSNSTEYDKESKITETVVISDVDKKQNSHVSEIEKNKTQTTAPTRARIQVEHIPDEKRYKENIRNRYNAFDDQINSKYTEEEESEDGFAEEEAKWCSGMNTVLDANGNCVCAKGFVGDWPIQKRGCWKCKTKCHRYAECMFTRGCQCNNGLVGDGVTECAIPAPKIVSFTPSGGYSDTNFIFDFIIETSYKPFSAFCNASGLLVSGELISKSSSINCTFPENIDLTKLSISFDRIHWSNVVSYKYTEDKISSIKIFDLISGLVFLVTFLYLLVMLIRVLISISDDDTSSSGIPLLSNKMPSSHSGTFINDIKPRFVSQL